MPPELDFAAMANDIVQKGYLRKAKSWNKRYVVLKDGDPALLEYYENEKKWKNSSAKPKRRLILEKPWSIDKKRNSRHEYLIVIFTEDEYISLAAETAEDQKLWIDALRKVIKPEPGLILFKHMWHVVVESNNLEGPKSNPLMNLHGPQRVCLTHDQIVFVHSTTNGGSDFSKGFPLEISMSGVRSYGHTKEGLVFISPGRACGITDGKLWMDLNDEFMAHDMHQTIRNASYGPKPDEILDYRSRSYSSGSNAGRTRLIRYNNPPPSQIGMGKLANASSSRIRCDSLIVSQMSSSSNDPRFRTGSEGEHTMKKPPMDGLKNAYPGVQGKHRTIYGKRFYAAYPHPYISHSHTTSLPGSCSGSSTTSSAEHLNITGNCSDIFMPVQSNAGHNNSITPALEDEYIGNLSGGSYHQFSKNVQNVCNDNAGAATNELADPARRFCSKCLNPLPIDIRFTYTESAPPPPDIDPPHISDYHGQDYVNYSFHSRGHSIDDSLSIDTPVSSLSASPQQAACNFSNSYVTIKKNLKSIQPSPKLHLAASTMYSSVTSSADEYTAMSSSSRKYPHQKVASNAVKLLSDGNVDSSKPEIASTLEYTQMILPFSVAEDQTNNDLNSVVADEYVHMRSVLPKPSTPQDIRYRRRSIPDSCNRMSASSSYRSSPTNEFSLPDDSFELVNSSLLCISCQSQLLQEQKMSKADNCSDIYKQTEPLVRLTSGFDGHINETTKYPSFLVKEAAAIAVKVSISMQLNATDERQQTDIKSVANKPSGNMSVQSLQKEIKKVNDIISNESDILQGSPPIISSERHEHNGYLLMTGLHGDLSSHSATLQYPYQKRSALSVSPKSHSSVLEQATNSLDRSKTASFRNGKLKQNARQFTVGTNKRSHSFRHSSKSKRDFRVNTQKVASSTPPPSPGGEYINIDREKALKQLDSPHIALSDDEISKMR